VHTLYILHNNLPLGGFLRTAQLGKNRAAAAGAANAIDNF
jgi:hypothetical protein